ncbi:AraC family ligand binding domain-containing protein, partial [Achromobacter xylosoxidans]
MHANQFVMQRSALAGVQAVAARSARTFARHTHEQFGIGVLRLGGQASHSGRGQVEAGPGQVITVNPGEVHDGAPIGGERAWQMLYLDPAVVAEAVDGLPAGAGFEFEHPVLDAPALAADLLALYAQVTAAAEPLACDTLLLRVLARARPPGAPAPPPRAPPALRPAGAG